MSRVRKLSLLGLFLMSLSAVHAMGIEELAVRFGDFIDATRDTATSLKSLTFATTRVAFPLGEVNVGFDLGGGGSGSLLLPLPSHQSFNLDFSNSSLVPGAANDFAKASMQVIQSQLRDVLGLRNLGMEDAGIDFFDPTGDAMTKKHWVERLLDFQVSAGMIYGIKLGLLIKDYLHNGREAGRSMFKYLADLGVLTIRLLRSWEHDSRLARGITSAIEEKAPQLGAMLREVSRRLPRSVNPMGIDTFIHDKLDLFWRAIMNADGLVFGDDGSIKAGLGFAVSGFDCGTAEDAAVLTSFLARKQISWDALESDRMKGQPFIEMVGNLVDMLGWQVSRMDGNEAVERRAEYARIRAVYTNALEQGKYADYGRFDPRQSDGAGMHHVLKSNSDFIALTAPGGPLADSRSLPRVVQAGRFVYFCTNKMSSLDSARVLAVITFQALWQYLDALRGQGKDGKQMLARVEQHQRKVTDAQRYLQTEESYFLHAHGPALFERPTTNVYSMASKVYEHPDSRKYVGAVVDRVKRKHMEGVKHRASLNIALLERFNTKFKKRLKTPITIPEAVSLPQGAAAA